MSTNRTEFHIRFQRCSAFTAKSRPFLFFFHRFLFFTLQFHSTAAAEHHFRFDFCTAARAAVHCIDCLDLQFACFHSLFQLPDLANFLFDFFQRIFPICTVNFISINEQISNFAQTYPTNLKASSNEALLFMRRYRFANCSCFSCCFKDAYPSSNVQ